ncbi:MAG: hypothetical protein JOY54_02120 [Acidobacteriaceae bacterium]|nr:hypothetical protein [Acidobacteriaceae bacterium]
MQPALLIRLRPLGPWRYGPEDGGRDRIDTLYRSDRLFSALTLAMRQLGFLEEWLDQTARAERPVVTFSSLFPFQGDTLFAIPPTTLWPPPANLVTTPSPVFLTKIRWKVARFVPLTVIDSLLAGQSILADQWLPDPESGCLLRRDRPSSSPFRAVTRSSAPVDRMSGVSHQTASLACVEFEAGAGLWGLAAFADANAQATWSDRVQAAFRLLADSGFGGRRSAGWGQAQAPEFQHGPWPGMLLPKIARLSRNGNTVSDGDVERSQYWLLSLYSPAASDQIDWAHGDYSLVVRSGRIESPVGQGIEKKSVRMVGEGSVLASTVQPIGAAVDVAPAGFAHPVFRAGFGLALELPVIAAQPEPPQQVEEPAAEEAIEPLAGEEPQPAPEPLAEPIEPPAEPIEPPAEPIEPPAEPIEPPAEPIEPPAELIEPPAEPIEPAVEAAPAPEEALSAAEPARAEEPAGQAAPAEPETRQAAESTEAQPGETVAEEPSDKPQSNQEPEHEL